MIRAEWPPPVSRYAGRYGSEFVFETRFVDGEFRRTVLIDSKQSQANRAEEGLLAARRDGAVAARIPVIEVQYEGREALTDLSLPHRAFDAHIRFASQDGVPVVRQQWYRDLRDATHADLAPVFVASPATPAFGGWDSSRRTGQLRLRGLLVSELFGVVADGEDRLSRRSGARLDPLGQDFHVTPDEFAALIDQQREELSPTLVTKLDKQVEAARKKKGVETLSAAAQSGWHPAVDRDSVRRVRPGGSTRSHVLAGGTAPAALRWQRRRGCRRPRSPAGNASAWGGLR